MPISGITTSDNASGSPEEITTVDSGSSSEQGRGASQGTYVKPFMVGKVQQGIMMFERNRKPEPKSGAKKGANKKDAFTAKPKANPEKTEPRDNLESGTTIEPKVSVQSKPETKLEDDITIKSETSLGLEPGAESQEGEKDEPKVHELEEDLEFSEIGLLGEGSFGKVVLVKNINNVSQQVRTYAFKFVCK